MDNTKILHKNSGENGYSSSNYLEMLGFAVTLIVAGFAAFYATHNEMSFDEFLQTKRSPETQLEQNLSSEARELSAGVLNVYKGQPELSANFPVQQLDTECFVSVSPSEAGHVVTTERDTSNDCEFNLFYNKASRSFLSVDPIYSQFDSSETHIIQLLKDIPETTKTPLSLVNSEEATDRIFTSQSYASVQPTELPPYKRREVVVHFNQPLIVGEGVYRGFRIYGSYDTENEMYFFDAFLNSLKWKQN